MKILIPVHWKIESIDIPFFIKISKYLISRNNSIIIICESTRLKNHLIKSIGSNSLFVINVRDYIVDDEIDTLNKLSNIYGVTNWKELCLPQKLRSMRRWSYYQTLLCKSIEAIEDILSKHEVNLCFNYLGGEIKRRVIEHIGNRTGFPSIYMAPSIFQDRLHYFNGEMFNIHDHTISEVNNRGRQAIENNILRLTDDIKNDILEISPINMNKRIKIFRAFKDILYESAQKYFFYKSSYETPIINKRYRKVKGRVNDYLSSNYQMSIDLPENYVFYPLQYQTESAQTVRGRIGLFQEYLIDVIAAKLPSDHTLIIKEHPDVIGGLNKAIRRVIDSHSNIIVLPKTYNSRKILKRCSAIITLAGTTGIEAIAHGIRPIVVGDIYYKIDGYYYDGTNISNYPDYISHSKANRLSNEDIFNFFELLYNYSYPGIFERKGYMEDENIINIANNMIKYYHRSKR
jgi:hypothetical protein